MSNHHQIDLIEFPAESEENLQVTTRFFSDVFGWEYKDWGGVYSDTQSSGVASGVSAAPQGKPTMPLAVVYSNNLEATKQKVIEAGGKISADIYPFPGGRRFHFIDPSNNELAVWSE